MLLQRYADKLSLICQGKPVKVSIRKRYGGRNA
jgi:hypothetical protein